MSARWPDHKSPFGARPVLVDADDRAIDERVPKIGISGEECCASSAKVFSPFAAASAAFAFKAGECFRRGCCSSFLLSGSNSG